MNMMTLPTVFSALLLCLPLCLLLKHRVISPVRRSVLFVIVGILLLLPVGQLSIAGYLYSFVGDLSISSLTLLIILSVQLLFNKRWIQPKELKILAITCLAAGFFLYPMALGLTGFDPYSFGYHPTLLGGAVFIASILLVVRGYYFLLLVCQVTMIAFSFKLMESNNFWDYLLDPIIVFGSAAYLIRNYLTQRSIVS